MTSPNGEDYAGMIQATNSMWRERDEKISDKLDETTGLPALSFMISASNDLQQEAASEGQVRLLAATPPRQNLS